MIERERAERRKRKNRKEMNRLKKIAIVRVSQRVPFV